MSDAVRPEDTAVAGRSHHGPGVGPAATSDADRSEVLDLTGDLPIREERPYDPEPGWDKVRAALALSLVAILAATVGLSYLLMFLKLALVADVKELLGAVFPPLVALTGSALGFYFGGKSRS